MSGNTPVPPPVPPRGRDEEESAGANRPAPPAQGGWTTPPPAAPAESIPTQAAPVWDQPTQYSVAAQPDAGHPATPGTQYQPTQAGSYQPTQAAGPFRPTQAPGSYQAQGSYRPAPGGYGAGQGGANQPRSYGPSQQAAPAFPATPAAAQRAAGSGTNGEGDGRPPEDEKKDRLGAGWIAFIVIDVILVIVTVLYAISFAQGRSSNGGDDPSTPAAQHTTTVPKVTDSRTFASESRNITCKLTNLGAECTIASMNSTPETVDGCSGVSGYKAALSGDTVSIPCLTSRPGQAAPDVTILNYGKSATIGEYTCDSEQTGMTCVHTTTGRGFTISRSGIVKK